MPRDSKFGLYSGDDLANMPQQPYKTLIEDILYEGDYVMLIGTEGLGKSILMLQLGCCLSCGDDFLDMYEVPQPVSVLYVQTEGSVEATRERLQSMRQGIMVNGTLFHTYYREGIQLDKPEGLREFLDVVDRGVGQGMPPPRVIILDPVYSSMRGDLSSNECVRSYIRNIRVISDTYKSAIILVHHEHKQRRDFRGNPVHEAGREAVFGSTAFNAAIDSGFRLQKLVGSKFKLSNWKDRNDRCTKGGDLRMLSNPLMFINDTDASAGYAQVIYHIRDYYQQNLCGITIKELMQRARLGRDAVNKALRYWKEHASITRDGTTHPAQYRPL